MGTSINGKIMRDVPIHVDNSDGQNGVGIGNGINKMSHRQKQDHENSYTFR